MLRFSTRAGVIVLSLIILLLLLYLDRAEAKANKVSAKLRREWISDIHCKELSWERDGKLHCKDAVIGLYIVPKELDAH